MIGINAAVRFIFTAFKEFINSVLEERAPQIISLNDLKNEYSTDVIKAALIAILMLWLSLLNVD